jgi:hypothetical protein
VEQTNVHYQQHIDRQAGQSHWLPDITLPDIMPFIALALQMGHALKETLHDHNKHASKIIYPTVLPSVLFSWPEKGHNVCVPDMAWACVWCFVLRNITIKWICKGPQLWIYVSQWNSDPKCHRPSAATRIMWVIIYLHQILYNAVCDSQA